MPSRYLVGIDLGTTNSALAYIDTQADGKPIEVFPVPQLVAHGEVRTLAGLPSFIYFPTEAELSSGAVSATWEEDPAMVTGVMAREQGALAPSRQVSSAKSWLSSAGTNRREKILPAQAEAPQPMISPVEASTRYLMHLRDAWNAAHADDRFEHQDIVLTVPASFDEEARELTVEAAHRAKLLNVTLLEEPLAAFYAWLAIREDSGSDDKGFEQLHNGDLILICDVGGGTSDFSLVRARQDGGAWQFERMAVGEHILLGGDNLDLAIAQLVESKLTARLSLLQRYALRESCRTAKERLLSNDPPDHVAVTILGSGSTVIGQSLTVELGREEVLQILTSGFLPLTAAGEFPARTRATGLRELGLPYASDPAVTRHLSAFLSQAAAKLEMDEGPLAQPEAVLFNGGFFTPAVARERTIEAISTWFSETERGWRPKLLENRSLDSAVAQGAAYYGSVRRGNGVRVEAGSARSYFVGLPSADGLEAVCVLPAGTQEGTALPLRDREFSVLANRPVSFTLYSSRTRHDEHGQVAKLDASAVHRHAPLVTLLRYGKKLRDVQLAVTLKAIFTEVGTLELWCESRNTDHRWRLQFELRSEQPETPKRQLATAPLRKPSESMSSQDGRLFEVAVEQIRGVFAGNDNVPSDADSLVTKLETVFDRKRESWPIHVIRPLDETLLEASSGRRKSPRHEVRWLNLTGFCLRPGFGALGDEALVKQANLSASQLEFPNDVQCQAERLVFLRRIAGGVNASEQHALYRTYSAMLLARGRRSRLNPQVEHELWRLFGNLEQLSATTRASLGERLLGRVVDEPKDAIFAWALGRIGARIPLYGPLHSVVSPETASKWIETLLKLDAISTSVAQSMVQIARLTGDSARDVAPEIRQRALARLAETGATPELLQPLSQVVAPSGADVVRSFGEPLPPGLELITSADCLLSPPGLSSISSKRPA